jgi:hypothetical protein
MSSLQFVSQQSDDLDMYLPSKIDFEDELFCSSVEMLTHSIDFNFISSAHRIDSDMFDPITDDMAASYAFTMGEPYNNNFNKNDLSSYLHEPSTVVPHIPRESPPLSPASIDYSNMSSPGSPLKSALIDIKKFMVFDETTGRERRPLLHEFIRLILENDEYSNIAEYIDRKRGIFKLHRPKDVSELWKHVKGRNSDNGKRNFLIKNVCLSNCFLY